MAKTGLLVRSAQESLQIAVCKLSIYFRISRNSSMNHLYKLLLDDLNESYFSTQNFKIIRKIELYLFFLLSSLFVAAIIFYISKSNSILVAEEKPFYPPLIDWLGYVVFTPIVETAALLFFCKIFAVSTLSNKITIAFLAALSLAMMHSMVLIEWGLVVFVPLWLNAIILISCGSLTRGFWISMLFHASVNAFALVVPTTVAFLALYIDSLIS